MFERYTEHARRALFFARYEASHSGTITIEPEQLLLGLMREGEKGSGLVTRLLGELRIDDVRRELDGTYREKVSTSVEIPFSADTKKALQCAAEEADRLLHNYIGCEHLLLGLLRVEQSRVATFLTTSGLTLNGTRERLVQLLQESGMRAEQFHPQRPGRLFVRSRPQGAASSAAPRGEMHSQFEVSIEPAANPEQDGGEHGSPGHWSFSGTTLEQLLVILCECQRERLELSPGLDGGLRYNVAFSYAPEQPKAVRRRLLLACVEAHFRMSVSRERRSMDAWVLTAPNGPGPALKAVTDEHGPGVGHGRMKYVVPRVPDADAGASGGSISFGEVEERQSFIQSISFPAATMRDLAEMLEGGLRGPVVDETGLTGRYRIDVATDSHDPGESLRQLLEPLGLVATRGKRDIDLVVVRPAAAM